MPSWPVRFDGRPPKLDPAPLLGQHSAEILGEWLGMNAGDIETLRKEGVI
jgi:crotonobetainyl-CoA:carnitine CoA-transferase CaiB-like acyl-CoA transferase